MTDNTITAADLVQAVRRPAKDAGVARDVEQFLSTNLGLQFKGRRWNDEKGRYTRQLRLADNQASTELDRDRVAEVLTRAENEHGHVSGVRTLVSQVRNQFGLNTGSTSNVSAASGNTGRTYQVTWTARVTEDELRRRGWGVGSQERYAREQVLQTGRFDFTSQAV